MEQPKVTLLLLDWDCRESFHIFNYLKKQDIPRDWFEVQWIEFYSRRSPEIGEVLASAQASGQVPPLDLWLVLDVPETYYYHKHFMYNAGIALARGELVCIMDSDAMLRPGFVRSLVEAFDRDPGMVLHLDEVRNVDRRFHPFAYPSFEEVLGPGCINWNGTATVGLADERTPLFTRNYGACMCAPRQAMVGLGGADEHVDYLGHVCGPYDLTFRMGNAGRKEVWHPSEFLYHVWHPGTDGGNNYIGPHDGRNNSTRALQARLRGETLPALENPAIRLLRENPGRDFPDAVLLDALFDPVRMADWVINPESMALSLCRQAYYGSRFEEAVERYRSLSDPPQQADFLAEMGRALSITGRRPEARGLLEKALAQDPALQLAHSVLGWLEHNERDYRQALWHFERALSVWDCLTDDFLLEALRGQAWAYLHSGRNTQAELAFREAGGYVSENNAGGKAEILLGLGQSLLSQGRFQEAGAIFAKGLALAAKAGREDLKISMDRQMEEVRGRGSRGQPGGWFKALWGRIFDLCGR